MFSGQGLARTIGAHASGIGHGNTAGLSSRNFLGFVYVYGKPSFNQLMGGTQSSHASTKDHNLFLHDVSCLL